MRKPNRTGKWLFTLLLCLAGFYFVSAQTCTPYLGQVPPGDNPKRFQPVGYLSTTSWWWRSAPSFSPDGSEMYFTKYFNAREVHEIWFTKCVNGQWTTAAKASFSTSTFDGNVLFLDSNDTLYFYSQRQGQFIFKVVRTPTGWSEPVALNIQLPANSGGVTSYYITKNKTVYFGMVQTDGSTTGDIWSTADIFRTRMVNGQYTIPENLGSPVNSDVGDGIGYVDPDERFMILESKRTGGLGWYDMYLSIRNLDDTWNRPINLGSRINSSSEDGTPYLTPDGKYFFFSTAKAGDLGYNPYWVSARFIDEMVTGIDNVSFPSGGVSLNQNVPNPCNGQTRFSFELTTPGKISLKIHDHTGKVVSYVANNQFYTNGKHSVDVDISRLPVGIYTYVLKLENGKCQAKKIVISK